LRSLLSSLSGEFAAAVVGGFGKQMEPLAAVLGDAGGMSSA
jgi:hypothetical protein